MLFPVGISSTTHSIRSNKKWFLQLLKLCLTKYSKAPNLHFQKKPDLNLCFKCALGFKLQQFGQLSKHALSLL